MKIADLRLTGLAGGTVEGGWTAELTPEDNLHTIVEVITDDGRVGVGSAMTSVALVAAAGKLLRPFLIGERADEPARVSEKLRQHTFWQGRGGSVEHAISGIDIALWDLFGKICNQPVARLLGGVYRNRIKPYGSLLFDEPEPLGEKLKQAVARGFRAIKLGWKPFGRRDAKTDELLVRTARDVVGPNVELMVDAGGSDAYWPHGYKWALRTAQMLAGYDVTWFEEALPPDDLAGFVELRLHSPIPITTGEVLTRRQSFWPYIQAHAADILQPDCTKCGGLTEAWRIGWMAYEHNIQLVPHGWNTAVGLAADLHLTAALPVASYVEFITPSPYVDDLIVNPFRPDADGMLTLPDKPGLGIELNQETLKQYGVRV
ncbi:mandelate racemase/muconate lactonizing enzyme family protein [Fimbriiglobus ruber]|uniref:Gluconate dehydratase n=1 Tax=Fimbriiglobus ruber TaxID=1908690 RepID=A0A225E7B6_9BACT|nr:mandelate racemase/muconate lactonizing enzyme family protein [Fimbriiglobus ruber]OWK44555.1 Gluconate dehydratase [Fimbriiglobus ruber]